MVNHRKYPVFTCDLYLGVKVTQNVAQYPLHHITYKPAKLEVATSLVKEEMHLQENTLYNLDLGVAVLRVAVLHRFYCIEESLHFSRLSRLPSYCLYSEIKCNTNYQVITAS